MSLLKCRCKVITSSTSIFTIHSHFQCGQEIRRSNTVGAFVGEIHIQFHTGHRLIVRYVVVGPYVAFSMYYIMNGNIFLNITNTFNWLIVIRKSDQTERADNLGKNEIQAAQVMESFLVKRGEDIQSLGSHYIAKIPDKELGKTTGGFQQICQSSPQASYLENIWCGAISSLCTQA